MTINYSFTFTSNNQTLATPISQGIQATGMQLSRVMPQIIIYGETPAGEKVSLTLEPEASISASDSLKLSMLLIIASQNTRSIDYYGYIQDNNLERHFRIKQV